MSKYCNEGYFSWSSNFSEKIFQQLKSSNRICLEYHISDINFPDKNSIRFYGRYYSNLDSRSNWYEYMIIISNDERRRLYREHKIV